MPQTKFKRHTIRGKDGRFQNARKQWRALSDKARHTPPAHPLEQLLRRDYAQAKRFYIHLQAEPQTEESEQAAMHDFIEAAWRVYPHYHDIRDDESQRVAIAG